MCQAIAKIMWDGQPRQTCPVHRGEKLRVETGCPTCGWGFNRGRQLDPVGKKGEARETSLIPA